MLLFLVYIISLLLSGCIAPFKTSKTYSCLDCHSQYKVEHSTLTCVDCHRGKEKAKTKKSAHSNLRKKLSLSEIESLCGKCHSEEINHFKTALHYTYEKELHSLFSGFSFPDLVKKMEDLSKISYSLSSKEGFLLDFLRRRCLTCHIFSEGENYKATRRSIYCFSCHTPHQLSKPTDKECLACHYSTRIGWDYYGFFPHNWFRDYRTPLVNGNFPERPYGIEAYLLQEDIHRQKNFKCIDCHTKKEIMEGKEKISCNNCHKTFKNSFFHRSKVLQKSNCSVCHANFLAKDSLRICYYEEKPDLEKWVDLAVQESSEIEELIESYLLGKKINYTMKDKITGEEKPGLWLCTMDERVFESLHIGKSKDQKLCLIREEKIILRGLDFELEGVFKRCKNPHSIGKGDIFRSLKVLRNIEGRP